MGRFGFKRAMFGTVKLIIDKNIKILSAEILGCSGESLPIDNSDVDVNLITAPDDSKVEVILQREGDRSPQEILIECTHDGEEVLNLVTVGKVTDGVVSIFRPVTILGGVDAVAV